MRRILTFITNKAANIKATFNRKKIEVTTAVREDFTSNKKLSVEQREAKTMRSVRRITTGFLAASMIMSTMGITCFAADGSSEGVETFNTVVQFIVDWVARIGLVIGFIGAVQFAMGFKDDSADGKTRMRKTKRCRRICGIFLFQNKTLF